MLVIEDDYDLARAVTNLLEDDGFSVSQRHDGESGFAEGLDGDYDVIVLDLMLPKRNGFSVCADLRAAGVDTPLLMLTAKEGAWDEVEGLEVGADAFLHKPFENAILVAHLHALLRLHDRGRPQRLIAGPISLDPLRRAVVAYDRDVTLTPREFALLEFLMGRLNEPVAKSEILREVWGTGFDGDPNIVEVYIGYLRRKIDQAPYESTIVTVRGFGYSIHAA